MLTSVSGRSIPCMRDKMIEQSGLRAARHPRFGAECPVKVGANDIAAWASMKPDPT
jgi:hypothetical protein